MPYPLILSCRRWLAALLLFHAASALRAQTPALGPAEAVLGDVKPYQLEAHVRYLAADELRGRLPGTPGYQLAVDYVVKQFRELGVAPAGERGGYTQRVRLRRAWVEPGAALTWQPAGAAEAQPLAAGFYPHPLQAAVTLPPAPLVFAGYGITAPARHYDDYAGLDVRGKVVVLTREAPRHLAGSGDELLHLTDLRTVVETAARHGAVGVLLAPARPDAPLPAFPKGLVSALTPAGQVAAGRGPAGAVQVVAGLGAAAWQQLLAGAGLDSAQVLAGLRAGQPASRPLPGRLGASYRSRHQDFDSYNVVGRVEGSDPLLRDSYMVHSAHLDHLGVGAPVAGDSIYNGAHDNATGVAAVLEIARLYTRLKPRPRRSVLLLLVTGEEMGLLGSAYFARYPTVPAAALVADVNTDMPTLIAPLLSVVPLGADHSSLLGAVQVAARSLGVAVEADPEPGQHRFVRSDQYSFVRRGVPAVHLKYGNKTTDGRNNLSETVQRWRAATYHQPQDNYAGGTFDWVAGVKYVQLNFLLGYQLAQSPRLPTWNKGDLFGE